MRYSNEGAFGLQGDTTPELCARWISAGSFYTFTRSHSTHDAIPQELYRWPEVARAARNALSLRYQLLPHLYTAFARMHACGGTVMRPAWWTVDDSVPSHADGPAMQEPVCRVPPGGGEGGGEVPQRLPEMAGELDQWLWGDSVMVTPVVHEGARERDVQVWLAAGACDCMHACMHSAAGRAAVSTRAATLSRSACMNVAPVFQ